MLDTELLPTSRRANFRVMELFEPPSTLDTLLYGGGTLTSVHVVSQQETLRVILSPDTHTPPGVCRQILFSCPEHFPTFPLPKPRPQALDQIRDAIQLIPSSVI